MSDKNCLGDETLAKYLEGHLPEPHRNSAEEHMVKCDFCRGQLALFMRILDSDVRKEEDAVVDAAIRRFERRRPGMAVPATGRDFLRSHDQSSNPNRRRAFVAVAATFIAGVGAVYFWINGGTSTDDVLDTVLAERRFRGRLSGQVEHAPFSNVRAPGDAADVALESMLRDATDYERAVFYLAITDFRTGLGLMQTVVEETPNAAAHNDLGVGLMEIGETVVDEGNFEAARREFQASIDADPEFAPPLFNMAILLIRQGMDDAAREYAVRYAALDPDSGWTAELGELEVWSP